LVEADALVCATASPVELVSAAAVAGAVRQRRGRLLVVVDIAVPRDVEPAVRALPGVRLIDLDDLEARCALDGAARRRELERAEALAREAAEACMAALRVREAVPDIVALRQQAEAIRAAELRRAAGRLSRLAPDERAAVEQVTHAIVQKLLHPPTVALRRATASRSAAARRARATILGSLQLARSEVHVPRSRLPGSIGPGAGHGAPSHESGTESK
jgi:glutamyl-tRNA reductase